MPCFQRIRITYEREDGDPQERIVPCGMCLGCRQEQARQWAVRMVHEASMHTWSWFITLTYDDAHLPVNGSLSKEDAGSFVRRLRRYYEDWQRRQFGKVPDNWTPKPLTFYLCGEYGSKTLRPHYHAVCFGPRFPDARQFRGSGRSLVWKSENLDAVWNRGFTEFSAVTMGSASYVAQYVRKKVAERFNGLERLTAEDGSEFYHPRIYTRVDDATGELVAVTPEFSRMSRRPAIGRRWIEKWWSDVYPRDYVVIDGHECKPPRYYDKWLAEHQPEVWDEVRARRHSEEIERRSDDAREYPVVEDHEERSRYRENAGKAKADSLIDLYSRRDAV